MGVDPAIGKSPAGSSRAAAKNLQWVWRHNTGSSKQGRTIMLKATVRAVGDFGLGGRTGHLGHRRLDVGRHRRGRVDPRDPCRPGRRHRPGRYRPHLRVRVVGDDRGPGHPRPPRPRGAGHQVQHGLRPDARGLQVPLHRPGRRSPRPRRDPHPLQPPVDPPGGRGEPDPAPDRIGSTSTRPTGRTPPRPSRRRWARCWS